jgi:hypothetical protein
MSGIPVYTQSPIRAAAKPSGVTRQTTAPDAQFSPSGPNPAPPTTTTASTSSYPSAQPGAAAPAPTTAAQRYAPLQPTPTKQTEPAGPPAPQPGAFPRPLNRGTMPPPPKVGETYHPPQHTAAPTEPYPPQMAFPPPTGAIGTHPPTSSTRTTNTPPSPYPVSIPPTEFGGPRRSMEHPPGYQQNTYAADLTSDQRRAQQAHTAVVGHQNSSHHDGDMDQESVWNIAKNWAQQAGEKLSVAEAEVWRKINKQ